MTLDLVIFTKALVMERDQSVGGLGGSLDFSKTLHAQLYRLRTHFKVINLSGLKNKSSANAGCLHMQQNL